MSGLCTCTKANSLQNRCTLLTYFTLEQYLCKHRDTLQTLCSGCYSAATSKLVAQLSHLDAFHISSGSILLDRPVSPAAGNPCAEQCRLRVYPDMDDGSACQDCASQHLGYWRYTRFASIDLLWGKAYGQDSVLMGTTQSHINSIVEAILHSEGFNVKALAALLAHAHLCTALWLLLCGRPAFPDDALPGTCLATGTAVRV